MTGSTETRLAVVGLGYVGLPLAAEFAKSREVLGFDINEGRIEALRGGVDATQELSAEELAEAKGLRFSCDLEDLRACNTYIVTVPTPIDEHKRPDLTPLLRASETLGKVLKPGDLRTKNLATSATELAPEWCTGELSKVLKTETPGAWAE